MRTFHDAKAMAKTLRQALSERNVSISHSECLELVAHQFGLTDWNTLSAIIARDPTGTSRSPDEPRAYYYEITDDGGAWTVSVEDEDGNHLVSTVLFSRHDCLTWLDHHSPKAQPKVTA